MRELGLACAVLVHRQELAKQTKEIITKEFSKTVSMGLVMQVANDYDADYVFAMVPTLNRDEHLFKYKPDEFDCIIIDEVHHVPKWIPIRK